MAQPLNKRVIVVDRGVEPGGWAVPDPLKIRRRGQSMFRPLKCHILHSKLL